MRALIFMVCAAWVSGCDEKGLALPVVLQGPTMGTQYSIKINSAHAPPDVELLHKRIEGLLEDINNKMSTYIDDSELMRINRHNDDDWIPVSPELFAVISQAQQISTHTRGAFDMTVGPLVKLWGFGANVGEVKVPDQTAIKRNLENVGYPLVQLQATPPSLRKLKPGVFIDLSAIAKGYAVDYIAEYLAGTGLTDFMVEIGGEILARGNNMQGVPWRIGIEKPADNIRSVQKIIPLKNMAMATSGDYRIYIEAGDRRYSHIINPVTGKALPHKLVSVTIFHPSAMQADALATAALVMGGKKALEYMERHRLAAFFIVASDDGFKEFYSSSFRAYLDRMQ